MIDRVKKEKVIKGIEHCFNLWTCSGCPYRGKDECIKLLMEDALELLKAQEQEEDPCKNCQEFVCNDCKIWIEKYKGGGRA